MRGTPPTSSTQHRASARSSHVGSPVSETHRAQTSAPTRLDEDETLWHSLKVEARKNGCALSWFSEKEVLVNTSKIRCAKNEYTINVATGNSETQLPIHAHSVNQLPFAESSCDRATMTYAAGQSPTQENYKNMLIQGIESGLGTFQMVSTKAHRHGSDSKETPLIKLLEAALNNPSKTVELSDRYTATKLEKISGDFGRSDDHVRYVMTVRDKRNPNKLITVPLTQAALPFTDKVLQDDKIERAHALMQAHCDESEKQAKANGRTSKWKDLMVLSHAGYGRNATVITYCRIAALASQSADSVNKNNLCEKLEEAIAIGMASRDPNFVHSRPQMSALRVALERKVLAQVSERPQTPRDGDARGRRHVSSARGPNVATAEAAAVPLPTSTPESVVAGA